MKLISVKCPSCNANVELNENLERATCNYCGAHIVTEQALNKVKIEIEVDGIEGKSKRLENAKTLLKFKNYSKAILAYKKLINDYPAECMVYSGYLTAITKNFSVLDVRMISFFFPTTLITEFGRKNLFELSIIQVIKELSEYKKFNELATEEQKLEFEKKLEEWNNRCEAHRKNKEKWIEAKNNKLPNKTLRLIKKAIDIVFMVFTLLLTIGSIGVNEPMTSAIFGTMTIINTFFKKKMKSGTYIGIIVILFLIFGIYVNTSTSTPMVTAIFSLIIVLIILMIGMSKIAEYRHNRGLTKKIRHCKLCGEELNNSNVICEYCGKYNFSSLEVIVSIGFIVLITTVFILLYISGLEEKDLSNKVYLECIGKDSSNIILKRCREIKESSSMKKYAKCMDEKREKIGNTRKNYIDFLYGGYTTEKGKSGYYLDMPYEFYDEKYGTDEEVHKAALEAAILKCYLDYVKK